MGDLFEVLSSKKRFDANKVTLVRHGGFPYIVRQSINNGQKGFIREDVKYLNEGNTISFGQDTATIFYQEKPYFTGDKIKILRPRDTRFGKHNAQFFLACMRKSFCNFAWGNQSFSKDVISGQTIYLPQTQQGDINFAFMEKNVRELEESRLHELEAYLCATGLTNYTLTPDEEATIDNIPNLRWQQYRIGVLFEKIKTNKLPYKAKELPKTPTDNYILPCLTSSFMNQGLNYYVPKEGATIVRNVISIPSNSDVYRAYYQSHEFTVLSDAYTIRWIYDNSKVTSKQYLFMVTCINEVTDLPIYSYKNKLGGWKVVKEKFITLPSTIDGKPDLAIMETLVSADQKMVIKDVVLYADHRLGVTNKL